MGTDIIIRASYCASTLEDNRLVPFDIGADTNPDTYSDFYRNNNDGVVVPRTNNHNGSALNDTAISDSANAVSSLGSINPWCARNLFISHNRFTSRIRSHPRDRDCSRSFRYVFSYFPAHSPNGTGLSDVECPYLDIYRYMVIDNGNIDARILFLNGIQSIRPLGRYLRKLIWTME